MRHSTRKYLSRELFPSMFAVGACAFLAGVLTYVTPGEPMNPWFMLFAGLMAAIGVEGFRRTACNEDGKLWWKA